MICSTQGCNRPATVFHSVLILVDRVYFASCAEHGITLEEAFHEWRDNVDKVSEEVYLAAEVMRS
jgi:hypothetical protein